MARTPGTASDAHEVTAQVNQHPAKKILNLRAGILLLTAVPADRGEALSGVAYTVYAAARDVEGNRKRVTGSNHQDAASSRFLLPAGRYFVTAAHSGGNASAETAITAGGTRDVQLRIVP